MSIKTNKDINLSIKDLVYILFIAGSVISNFITKSDQGQIDNEIQKIKISNIEEDIEDIEKDIDDLTTTFTEFRTSLEKFLYSELGIKLDYDKYFANTGRRLRSKGSDEKKPIKD